MPGLLSLNGEDRALGIIWAMIAYAMTKPRTYRV